VLQLLQGLPKATVASDGEVLVLIEQEQLMGRGIRLCGCAPAGLGTVDALLALER
jgi:hypothetical protein